MSKVKVVGWVEREEWERFTNPKTRKWGFGIRKLPAVFRYPFKSVKNFWSDRQEPVKVEVVIREVAK